jgi:HlyD family secretion protein
MSETRTVPQRHIYDMPADTVVNENRLFFTRSMRGGLSKSTRLLAWGVFAALLVGFAVYWMHGRNPADNYVTAPVTRGPLVRSVTATGTVNPVTVVQVGTYVSGPISAIYVDFNSSVKAGQLLAKIDSRPFQAQVDLSRAALANSEAQLRKDQANLAYQKVTDERDSQLLKDAAIAQDTMDSQFSTYHQAVAQVGLDQAAIQQQKASLQAALLNLHYTDIISPVDGTVVSRNVDVGQTVAASYETPTLFLVAKDLTKMQVDTNVSESDIGSVRIGQPVDFTVDAYTTKTFQGSVVQTRQAPITVQNVVTYDVVVGVSNPELLLMPGMTANITIVSDHRDDALQVPLRALAFTPRERGSHWQGQGHQHSEHSARVWVDDGGQLRPVRITRGIDDGNNVEVLSGDLKPGDEVVTDRLGPTNGPGAGGFGGGPGGPGGLHLHM